MGKQKKGKKMPQAAALHGYPTLSAAISGQSASLAALSADKALTLSAVWACVRLLAQTVSTLPLKVFQYDANGGKETVESGHYLQQLLTVRPNMQQTPCKMLEFLMASLCLRGNAYFEKRMIGKRTIALLPILPQHLISVLPDSKGVYQYTFWRDNMRHTLPEQQIWHIRGFGTDGFFGINPLAAAAASLQQALSADKTAGKLFSGGMSASGFIRYNNGFLNAEQRKTLSDSLNAFT
ncbi:phage portal protein, partial [Conchiformibius steedae]|uniref:phage portal protein n=1 Tax=Conchiformibius steedae TaxID=153493 RepID=UPI0026F04D72